MQRILHKALTGSTGTVKQVEMNYTRWKIIEAIHIKKQKVTSPLPTLALPPAPQRSINLFILLIYYSDNMHYITNTSLIILHHTAHILGTVFLSHVSLVCCNS